MSTSFATTSMEKTERPTSTNSVVLDAVVHKYRLPTFTLSISSLAIRPGEAVSVVGRSGTGKTTLLSLILGLIRPDSGKIDIGGQDPVAARQAGSFGVAFQNSVLLPWLTVFDNVALPWRLKGTDPDSERIEQLLTGVGLIDYQYAYPSELSGGMRSRVSLARALACGPSILVLDEPFVSLDEFTRMEMAVLVSKLQAESASTMLCVTHNMTEALLMTDRILLLEVERVQGTERSACIRHEINAKFRNGGLEVTSSEAFRKALGELSAYFREEGSL